MNDYDTTVSFDEYSRIAFERDLAVKQLSDYGLDFGQPKDENLVRIVRCKKCKHSIKPVNGTWDGRSLFKDVLVCQNGRLIENCMFVWENDFCSYGEE